MHWGRCPEDTPSQSHSWKLYTSRQLSLPIGEGKLNPCLRIMELRRKTEPMPAYKGILPGGLPPTIKWLVVQLCAVNTREIQRYTDFLWVQKELARQGKMTWPSTKLSRKSHISKTTITTTLLMFQQNTENLILVFTFFFFSCSWVKTHLVILSQQRTKIWSFNSFQQGPWAFISILHSKDNTFQQELGTLFLSSCTKGNHKLLSMPAIIRRNRIIIGDQIHLLISGRPFRQTPDRK